MKKYTITDKETGEILSRHSTLTLANNRLRMVDSVHSSLHSTDVDWLSGEEEALVGYRYAVNLAGQPGRRN